MSDPSAPAKGKTFGQDDHDGYISDLSFMPGDDGKLVSTSGDQNAILWDLGKGTPISFLKGHTADVNNVNFSQENPHICSTSSGDGTVRLWDLREKVTNGKSIRRFVVDGEVNGAAIFPNGQAIAFATENGVP